MSEISGFSDNTNMHLERCGEMVVQDALKRRPRNGFGVEPEIFETLREMIKEDVETASNPNEVFRRYGFMVRPDLPRWTE